LSVLFCCALFWRVTGTTAGPRAFSGPLGKRLSTCEQLPVTHFVKIVADLPNVNLQIYGK